jgi:hypothetical protein
MGNGIVAAPQTGPGKEGLPSWSTTAPLLWNLDALSALLAGLSGSVLRMARPTHWNLSKVNQQPAASRLQLHPKWAS